MAFEATRRLLRDIYATGPVGIDGRPLITEHPKKVIKQMEDMIANAPLGKRSEMVAYAKHYANLYYVGRHNQSIPPKVDARMAKLEDRANKMDIADKARDFVQKYGAPDRALGKFVSEAKGYGHRTHYDVGQSTSNSNAKAAKQSVSENVKEVPKHVVEAAQGMSV